jgi:hypothetical protein
MSEPVTTVFTCSKCQKEIIHVDTLTTGYGVNDKGEKVCFSCCALDDQQYMRDHGRIDLYLVQRVIKGMKKYFVINWPGTLEFPASVKKGFHNIARTRYDAWFTFEGKEWHGVNLGEFSQICRCKVNKN